MSKPIITPFNSMLAHWHMAHAVKGLCQEFNRLADEADALRGGSA